MWIFVCDCRWFFFTLMSSYSFIYLSLQKHEFKQKTKSTVRINKTFNIASDPSNTKICAKKIDSSRPHNTNKCHALMLWLQLNQYKIGSANCILHAHTRSNMLPVVVKEKFVYIAPAKQEEWLAMMRSLNHIGQLSHNIIIIIICVSHRNRNRRNTQRLCAYSGSNLPIVRWLFLAILCNW